MENFKRDQIVTEGDMATTKNWVVPKDLFYFDGHFPHNPVLPAVAIVDLSVQLVQLAFPKKFGRLESVPSAKFSFPLRPLAKTQIHAKPNGNGEWSVEWKDSETLDVAAQLRIRLQAL